MNKVLYESIVIFGICLFIFLALAVVSRVLLWNQRFTLDEGRIIDHFPKEKVFTVRELERLVLVTPVCAHLYLKRNDDSLFTVGYWYGKSEQDWLSFLEELRKWDPTIESKLFVSKSKWRPQLEVKSDISSSYQRVANLHKK